MTDIPDPSRLDDGAKRRGDLVASQPDPLLGYAVHFTRGSHPAAAAEALARLLPRTLGHIELVQGLNDIDDTGFRASLSILWQGFVRSADLPRCVGTGVVGLEREDVMQDDLLVGDRNVDVLTYGVLAHECRR